MTDLLAMELSLRLAEGQQIDERPIPRWWGEATHRLAISVIASCDPDLARKLESSAGLKPFTASNLRGPFKDGKLDPGAAYKLRLTALDRRVAEIFESARREGVLKPGAEVELDYLRFQVREAAKGETGLASTTYQSLTNSLFAPQPPPRKLILQFVSPTVFKSERRQMPFPMPDLVFGSLLDHWNASGSIPTGLPEEARKYARECLRPGRFDLHSRVLRLYGEVFRGFVGRVSFYTYTYDRYWMGMMAMLAEYSVYAGVGAKTTMGLGQCYPVREPFAPAKP
jgi:CRISPR-associated endoribonuclease Cas6